MPIQKNLKNFYHKIIRFINKNFLIVGNEQVNDEKRVLICYLSPNEFLFKQNEFHSNISDYKSIIKYFLENDFEVHLIKCTVSRVERYVERYKYKMVFGLGPAYYGACQLNPRAAKIVYCTESSPDFSLAQETRRINEFNSTYSNKVDIVRSGKYLNNDMIELSDGLILVGSEHVVKTYHKYDKKKYYGIYPSALFNKDYQLGYKKEYCNRNFLWFGSTGVVHKGLHLAIEAISKRPNYHLYIAGANESEIGVLPKSNNTSYLGRVNVQSKEFCELMDSISGFILPSCSEGCSTAASTCMTHGLIPIISKEAGIDIPTRFSYLDDASPDSIVQQLDIINSLSVHELNTLQSEISAFARCRFRSSDFSVNFSKIMERIFGDL